MPDKNLVIGLDVSYDAKSADVSGRTYRRPGPVANPQLIVDGGR